MSESGLRNVSDTARWVAIYRAMETERPDALFRDPYARQLGGERGEQIMRELPRGAKTAWPMVVRTVAFDEVILRLVDPQGPDPAEAVLNLAAGLDARPYRLRLPATLRWIEADLPGILDYKEEILAGAEASCPIERIRVDLADGPARRALCERLGRECRRVLVLSEGLLVYLTTDDVRGLARDLARQPSFRWWLIDLAAPKLLRMLQRTWGKSLNAAQAPLRFGPQEGPEFFSPLGWRPIEVRSVWDEARRLDRRPPRAGLYDLIGMLAGKKAREGFRRMSTLPLLANQAAAPPR